MWKRLLSALSNKTDTTEMNITIKSNLGTVAARLRKKLLAASDKDKLLRTVATSLLPEVKTRIHVDGKNADSVEIGTYSPGYMKVRVNKYNRTSDTKVILSLTSKMENEFVAVANGTQYGLGFLTPDSAQKAVWCEATYKEKIYALTSGEVDTGIAVAQKFVHDALH